MTLRNLQATKAEQYMHAVKQVITAITEDHLELASKYIKEAQYVRYDLDTAVTRSELKARGE